MVEISRKRLVNDSAWSVMSAVSNSVFGFGYLIVIGNTWKSGGLGIFSLCMSLYLIGSLLFNLGIHNAVLYEVAASGEDKKRASGFVYSALLSSLILGALGGALGFVFAGPIAAVFREPLMINMVKVFAFALPLFLLNKTALGILNAHRRMRLLAAVQIMRGGTILIYLVSAMIFKAGFSAIPYGFILAESLIMLLLLTACVRTHSFASPTLQRTKRLVSFGWKAGLSGIIGDVNTRLDILVIGIFWDSSIVGVYSVASAIAKGLWLVPSAIQRVTNPLIVQLYTADEKDKLHRTMDVLLRLGTSIFAVIALVLAIYIKPLIGLIYPDQPDMAGAAIPLYFLLPGATVFSGIAMLGSAPSTSIGRPENALKLSVIVLGVNLIFNIILVPVFAGAGAASATTVSLLAALFFFFYLCKKELDFEIPLGKLVGLFCLLCFLIAITVRFGNSVSHLVFLVAELIITAAILAAIRMVRKSDWNLFLSVLKSFADSKQ